MSLRGGQLAPVENNHPDGRDDSAEEDHDLQYRHPELAPGDAAPGAQGVNGRKALDEIDNFQGA